MLIAAEDASNCTALRLWCGTTDQPDLAKRALFAAERCESLGQAFALGIQAAIAHLIGARFSGALCAVGVSEDAGFHPRKLETAVSEGGDLVSGHKAFVTLGATAQLVLTAGRDPAGVLRMCVVRREQPEVRVTPLPLMSFAPDLRHARLAFDGARVQEVLRGDGYTAFVKPFRVLEDLYTRLTACEYALHLPARTNPVVQRLLESARSGIQEALSLEGVQNEVLLLEEVLARADGALRAVPSSPTPATQSVWSRDLRLLEVGASARAARLAKARPEGKR